MRKPAILNLASLAMLVVLFTFTSCQKEELTPEAVSNPKTCLSPRFRDKVVTTACSNGYSCTMVSVPLTPRNQIKWRVGSGCPTDTYTGAVDYDVYKYVGPAVSPAGYFEYQKVYSFTCSGSNIWYASTVLTNTTSFHIVMNISGMVTMPASVFESPAGFLHDSGGSPLVYADDWKLTTGTAPTTSCW